MSQLRKKQKAQRRELIEVAAKNLFVEKGFDNVFLLTGGLEAFIKDFPQTVEGTLPEEAGMDDHLRGIANKSASRPPLGNSKYIYAS